MVYGMSFGWLLSFWEQKLNQRGPKTIKPGESYVLMILVSSKNSFGFTCLALFWLHKPFSCLHVWYSF
jgi:hypothetical protein